MAHIPDPGTIPDLCIGANCLVTMRERSARINQASLKSVVPAICNLHSCKEIGWMAALDVGLEVVFGQRLGKPAVKVSERHHRQTSPHVSLHKHVLLAGRQCAKDTVTVAGD